MSTKIHAIVDALGNPLDFILTPGQACDLEGSDAFLSGITAQALPADKAFDAGERVIDILTAMRCRECDPAKIEQKRPARLR